MKLLFSGCTAAFVETDSCPFTEPFAGIDSRTSRALPEWGAEVPALALWDVPLEDRLLAELPPLELAWEEPENPPERLEGLAEPPECPPPLEECWASKNAEMTRSDRASKKDERIGRLHAGGGSLTV
jgi:hypothetical protein